ncbi:helix-turn-helix domain-containing protein [Lutibaculum baratangense]|uniref:Transcriptional regulator, Crp/Fnr family n=1 Tax=Lutibaculum baratangense AMV1 TaxID=631454 RepID=V4RKA0_9HYPH|nr:helix-turn-helix domain-containing protein [Lutibaculum baratangense]ESR25754.1 transcriptional regulator, Crp/Fnr family [Lutibaculum baratangense AMV1]
MRSEDLDHVRALSLFRDAREETFDMLVQSSFLQRFPAGLVLIEEAEPADFLHVVIDGAVEMFARNAGRETTLSFVYPIGTFILAAVLKDQVNLQSARTLERSRILMIPAASVREAMQADTSFMSAIVSELATGYRTAIKDLKNHKLRTGAERLANWILRLDVEQGGSGTVELGVEKRVLAARLGMTPENLSRAFTALKPHGVEVRGARVTLADPDRLRQLAQPNPIIDDYTT